MTIIVYPEDISDIIDNPSELRKQIENFVKDYKIITFSEFSSKNRHQIYKQMYYPLSFEKIVDDSNNSTIIRVYNKKIKNKSESSNNDEDFVKTGKTEKTDNDEKEKNDNEESEESEDESESEVSDDTDSSYITDEDEQIQKIESLIGQVIETQFKIDNNVSKLFNRVNYIILLNIIGWIMLYTMDPVRLTIAHTDVCVYEI